MKRSKERSSPSATEYVNKERQNIRVSVHLFFSFIDVSVCSNYEESISNGSLESNINMFNRMELELIHYMKMNAYADELHKK